jgi:chromosomal replication initiator protein
MSVSAESLWASCLASLKTMLKPELYDLWFSPLRARSLVEEVLTLEVGDEFTQMWINDNYLDLLRSVVSRTAVQPIQVEFVVVPRLPVLETPPPVVLEEAPAVEAAAPDSASNGRPSETLLSPNYTFSTFVVGNNNEFAHSASRAVAHNPGKAFNPLFLFGGVGLGKTHLLHAIGHEINAAKRNGGKVESCDRRFHQVFPPGAW